MKKEKSLKKRFEKAKKELLNNKSICKENRDLFKDFFTYQENKLKRVNGLRELDNSTYSTLYGYLMKFKNINKWFDNKPIKELTEADIKRVYDGLEDGKILNRSGKPFEKLQDTYYSKIFKSKLFELAGVIDKARNVIQYAKKSEGEVRFITEENFRSIVDNAYKPHHKLLLWLCWDIGENINALLKIKKIDLLKQKNPHTKEEEYRINLRKEILKRSRKQRSEITNYNETVHLLDQHLKNLKEEDLLFNFEYGMAKKIMTRAVERAGVKCIPNGEKTTFKDLRSGMACNLLKKGWNTDEVNARLGHRPSSEEIDKYINFLAIDRHTPKKKVHQFEMEKINEELQEVKRREKLQIQRNKEMEEKLRVKQIEDNKRMKVVIGLANDIEMLKKKVGAKT